MLKKFIILASILFLLIIAYLTSLSSLVPQKWPDFIKYDDEYYLRTDEIVDPIDIDNMLGSVESKSPRRSSKYIPVNYEAGKLPVGTNIYGIKNNPEHGLAAYFKGKYIYYEKINEAEFYTAVMNMDSK